MRTRHCTIPYRSAYGKYSKIGTVRLPEHTYAGTRMYLRSTWGIPREKTIRTGLYRPRRPPTGLPTTPCCTFRLRGGLHDSPASIEADKLKYVNHLESFLLYSQETG